jgi:hypothetical protein
MRTIAVNIFMLVAFWLMSAAQASDWGGLATISSTLGINPNRLCIAEASRGDIGCPLYAPLVSNTGVLEVSAGLSVNQISLTSAGVTWGYLRSSASYLPNLASNNISTTSISVTSVNGTPVDMLGWTSPTDVPIFMVTRNGTNQSVTPNANIKTDFTTIVFDNTNAFNLSNDRYIPKIPGYYLFIGSIGCPDRSGPLACIAIIYKNGMEVTSTGSRAPSGNSAIVSSIVLWMNGTTDYAELYGWSQSGIYVGSPTQTYFTGYLLSFGNGMVSTTIPSEGGSSGTSDKIISGTLSVTANSVGNSVSLTTAATTWGYLAEEGSYLPHISTTVVNASTRIGVGTNSPTTPLEVVGTISTTSVQFNSSAEEVCDASSIGKVKVVNGKDLLCR